MSSMSRCQPTSLCFCPACIEASTTDICIRLETHCEKVASARDLHWAGCRGAELGQLRGCGVWASKDLMGSQKLWWKCRLQFCWTFSSLFQNCFVWQLNSNTFHSILHIRIKSFNLWPKLFWGNEIQSFCNRNSKNSISLFRTWKRTCSN